jgi:selenocysteine lyase/cysteine desulfurase
MAVTQLAPGSPEVLALFEQRRRAYVDSATVGLPPKATVEALEGALRSWQAGTARWDEDWEPAGELCRQEIAPMLGAPAEEIALVPAVSVGVAPVAAALGPEDEVVVPEDEFDSLLLPLTAVAERRGARVRRVPFRDVADAVGSRTTVVATSHVKSNGGAVQDLDAVAASAAGVGARVVVDATHSAGLLPIEAANRGLDVVVAAAYKHLLCPRGVAFARMAPEAQRVYAPVSASWVSVDPRSYYGSRVAQLADDARRFDVSLAWHAWVGALESLRFLNAIPAEERSRWCVSLASELADRVEVAPTGSSFLSVPVDVPLDELVEQLEAADVAAAIRAGEVRVSFHVYNTRADVDYVAGVLRTMRRQEGALRQPGHLRNARPEDC